MTIVQVEELVNYLGDMAVDADARKSFQAIIAGVEGEVEQYIARPIRDVTVTEDVMFVDGVGLVSESPVKSVTAVEGYATPDLAGVVVRGGVLRSEMHGWPFSTTMNVTYVAGPGGATLAQLRLTVLRIAAREARALRDDVRARRNPESRETPPEVGLTEQDRLRLDRFRRKIVR